MDSKNDKKLNIVLYEPEIANNVGKIMRSCVAVNAKLHLIEPLGFFLDDRFVKRASANYWQYLDYETYDNWEDIFKQKILTFYYIVQLAMLIRFIVILILKKAIKFTLCLVKNQQVFLKQFCRQI